MAVKRYDGSAWQTVAGLGAQGPAATSSSIATWVKTASGGETSLSGNDDNSQSLSYTVGQELVFINGTLLKRGSDYTATNGTSITGLTALAANDVATVWTVNAFSVTGAIANTIVDAKGDILVGTAADTPGRLAVGTNGQVLTAASTTGTGLTWTTPASGGGLTLLQTLSLSGSSVSSASISSSYKNIFCVLYGIYGSGADHMYIRFNSDTGNNYSRAELDLANVTPNWGSSASDSLIYAGFFGTSSADKDKMYGTISIPRYTTVGAVFVNIDNQAVVNSNSRSCWAHGTYDNAAAISTIDFYAGGSTFSGGTVYIYGED